MSIQITLTFTTVAEAVVALSKLEVPAAALPPIVPPDVQVAQQNAAAADAMADTQDPAPEVAAKPGKPRATRAAPEVSAPSPRTAEAAPSTPAPSDAAPEKASSTPASESSTATGAAATSAEPAEAFEYATLQKAVNERVAKHGKAALLAIAEKHGAPNFKALPADKWAAAHADVVALGA